MSSVITLSILILSSLTRRSVLIDQLVKIPELRRSRAPLPNDIKAKNSRYIRHTIKITRIKFTAYGRDITNACFNARTNHWHIASAFFVTEGKNPPCQDLHRAHREGVRLSRLSVQSAEAGNQHRQSGTVRAYMAPL